ncbi:MAG TPA: CsgG/HfaB family protein [Gemmatimonadaceae bacterium]
MSRVSRVALTSATLAFSAFTTTAAQGPVVVVFTFTNSSIGANRADFDGIATGVQDLLITDLASNPSIRLVDRARINEVLQEQSLAKNGQLDQATAVRVGKILGAQYAITGGFMAANKGQAVLTGRTIDLETTQIANPQKITGNADDVLGMIAQLSSKISSDMKLTPKPGRRVGDAGDAAHSTPAQSGSPKATPANASPATSSSSSVKTQATASKSAPLQVEHFAKAVTQPEKLKQTKLDVATLKMYSDALDEVDKQNNPKAITLLKQVLAKYQGFEPAQRQLDKLTH